MVRAVVDLRSDTVTQPTSGMRDAMMSAPLGDDVFGDDPTVIQLQKTAAALLGKEAGLFVPSGTMSNQLALKAQCRAGDEIIIHEGAHIYNYESGAAAALAGVQVRTVRSADGSLPLDQVLAGIHQTPDPHYAPTGLICFENTHNACGGMVVPEGNVTEITRLAASPLIWTVLVCLTRWPRRVAAQLNWLSLLRRSRFACPKDWVRPSVVCWSEVYKP